MTLDVAEYSLSKHLVARSFGLAAGQYQEVNHLQQAIAHALLERLEMIKISPRRVLDLGSGPGTSSSLLAKQFRRATIVEMDISLPMLKQARKLAPRFFSRRQHLCADADRIALSDSSVEMVFSNLMLQWCNSLDRVLSEVRRVLQDNGLFIFSSFGPDTLVELRKSWQEADAEVHVNAFLDMHDIGDALISAGMENPVMECEWLTVNYDTVFDLMRDLKKLGAHNINSGRRKTLTGKQRLQAMVSAYEKYRVGGKLPASYEVIYGHAWMPASTRARRIDGQTHVFPVASLKSGKP